MRTLSGAAATALSSPMVPLAVLIDMDLTSPLRLCTGGWTLTYGGDVYTAVGTLGAIDSIRESASEPAAIRFTISGVPSAMVSLALSEPVQGAAVTLYVAVFDPSTYQILDAAVEWSGTLDTMTISEDGVAAGITVTAEHAGIDLLRAHPTRFTDADQQRLYPGDLGFEYVTDQADQTIIWPAKEWFRR
jgi:hypothetical protein